MTHRSVCDDTLDVRRRRQHDGTCNSLGDRDIDDFDDLDETDVIGGNKFISTTFEYRFPISETIGLLGVAFFDTGNAFDEDQSNLVRRRPSGATVPASACTGSRRSALLRWCSASRSTGSRSRTPVFEFSVGGSAF